MMRKRDARPPFEVMRGSLPTAPPGTPGMSPGTSSGSSGSPHAAGAGQSAGEGDGVVRRGGESWAKLRQPMVFRLPPGYAILVGLGMVILIVLAYSAGYSQGSSRAQERLRELSEADSGIARRLEGMPTAANPTGNPRLSGGSGGSGVSGGPGAAATGITANQGMDAVPLTGSDRVFDDPSLDPRKPGYQYYIIAHCSRDEAQRLVAFMQERGGVEAAAVLLHNKRQYVVFILAPFTREQTTSTEARELKLKIFELGKVWASRTYRGPTNLSDTYLALYNPKPD